MPSLVSPPKVLACAYYASAGTQGRWTPLTSGQNPVPIAVAYIRAMGRGGSECNSMIGAIEPYSKVARLRNRRGVP